MILMDYSNMRIDQEFDVAFANEIAIFESYNKHLYRPNSYLHKWWARRCGSTFRTILKHLVPDRTKWDYYAAGGLEGVIILDPMMGGGTTLHEAIRLGANVIGADIDPIPLLQVRATLSNAPLGTLIKAFKHLYTALHSNLSPLYQTNCPHCSQACEWQFMVYGLHRQCACREVLTIDSLILRYNSDNSIIHIDPESHAIFHNEGLVATPEKQLLYPLIESWEKLCDKCQQPYKDKLDIPYYQRYVPVAVMGDCLTHGFFFNAICHTERLAAAAAESQRELLPFEPADFAIVPGPKSKSLVDRQINSYLDVYSSRQLVFLHQAIETLPQFDPLISLNLALLISTALEFNSLLCGYKGAKKNRPGAIRHTFAHHAYSFPYTAVENNPLYPQKASGNLQNLFHSRIVRGRQWAAAPEERRIINGKPEKVIVRGETDAGTEVFKFQDLTNSTHRFMLIQGSSITLDLPGNSIDFVVTDPPYFDSVQYGDLAAFFRVWLRKLAPIDVNWQYNLDGAAVDQHANGNGQYDRVLGEIFAECHRVLRANGRLIFTFHHWNPKGWSALTKALHRSGFVLVNRYVVHSENQSSVHIVNQKALLHDVVLVLAPSDSGIKTEWEMPYQIDLDDSQSFCQECGTMLGWMLNQNLSDEIIDVRWIALLTNTNSQLQLLEKHDSGI
jgi:putative DNA methylase